MPGKALVIVMRVGLTAPYGVRPATAALSTFYETLAMMAAGALVAALGFAMGPRRSSFCRWRFRSDWRCSC